MGQPFPNSATHAAWAKYPLWVTGATPQLFQHMQHCGVFKRVPPWELLNVTAQTVNNVRRRHFNHCSVRLQSLNALKCPYILSKRLPAICETSALWKHHCCSKCTAESMVRYFPGRPFSALPKRGPLEFHGSKVKGDDVARTSITKWRNAGRTKFNPRRLILRADGSNRQLPIRIPVLTCCAVLIDY